MSGAAALSGVCPLGHVELWAYGREPPQVTVLPVAPAEFYRKWSESGVLTLPGSLQRAGSRFPPLSVPSLWIEA